MGAVWYRARIDLRRRVGGTVLLVLLVGAPSGIVLAGVAGSIRTREALPEFIEFNRAYDASAFVNPGLAPREQRRLLDEIAALPEWETVALVSAAVITVELPDGEVLGTVAIAVLGGPELSELDRPIVIEGRLGDPDEADEVVLNEAMAADLGVRAGDTFEIRTVTPESLDALANGQMRVDPNGETLTVTAAAVVREPRDLRSAAQDQRGTTFSTDAWAIWTGPALWAELDGRLANYGIGARGRVQDQPGAADRLAASVAEVAGRDATFEVGNDEAVLLSSIRRAVGFEANALLLFALVVAVATALLVGQTIGRQTGLDLVDDGILRAAGLRRLERAAVPLVRAGVVAVGGAIVAVAVAVVLSPLAPVGLARRAELDSGVQAGIAVMTLGGIVVLFAVVGRAAATSLWATRAGDTDPGNLSRQTRPSLISGRLATLGAPMTTLSGVRLALDRGHGRTAVPVSSTIVTAIAGVLAVVAILVFGVSLDRLVATPALHGWTWDVAVGNFSRPDTTEQGAADLRATPEVESYVGLTSQPATVDDVDLTIAGLGPGDPSAGPQTIDGRLPAAADEIALGRQTLADLDRQIGDQVSLAPQTGVEPVDASVVGTIVPPAGIDASATLGRGGVMTLAGLQQLYGEEQLVPQSYLVHFADSVDLAEGEEALRARLGDTIVTPRRPDDVENLRRVQRLPALLAGVVGAIALGSLAHTLVTSVHRRRRELATLATLGFRRRQLSATIAWQATTFALIALVFGVPFGIALGRATWGLMSDSLGVEIQPTIPLLALTVVSLTVLMAANAVAALPARSAARAHPADILRTE